MNRICVVGNVVAKPELRSTPAGVSVTTFTVAVTRRFDREKTDFFSTVAWRQLADNCARYLDKGRKVAVNGEMQSRTYEDKNGNKKTVWEIKADDVEFLERNNGTLTNEPMQSKDVLTDDLLPF